MRLFLTLMLAAMALPAVAQAADPFSYAEPDKVVITHLDLDLDMDFQRQVLRGEATLTLDWKKPDAKQLVLDTRDLHIASVRAVSDQGSKPLEFELAKPDDELGSKLTIMAPAQPHKVRIAYVTAPDASGLQWLTREQTADNTHAFMYSQSQAIHARSWIPLQDTPSVRFTYSADISAPDDVRVIMSAINDPDAPLDGEFHFEQPKPIPSYLMAVAGGDIAVRPIGPRSAVYAEPSVVEKAAHEFEDTEQMIAVTEKMYGPYRWGRFDILVLPPSFPYGGMENPNMTFATPTLLVGDKSLVSVIAHELAHSWSGNLVTSATWRDFWLNEGFTTYVQGRITEAVYGEAQANEEILVAARQLQRDIDEMPANLQKLAPDSDKLGGAMATLSGVAYTKGAWLLRMLEKHFGREVFDDYLKSYFDHFAFQSITTEQMLAYMKSHLFKNHPGKMSWDKVLQWVHEPGIPDSATLPESPYFKAIDKQRKAFLAGERAASNISTEFTVVGPDGEKTTRPWNTQEWMYFLDGLPDDTELARIKALDAAFPLTGTSNAEIGMRWYSHAIRAGDKAVWDAAAEHMTRIGRLYLTMPLYHAFVTKPEGLAFAEKVYAKAKAGYHPLTQNAVERVLAEAHAKFADQGDADKAATDKDGD